MWSSLRSTRQGWLSQSSLLIFCDSAATWILSATSTVMAPAVTLAPSGGLLVLAEVPRSVILLLLPSRCALSMQGAFAEMRLLFLVSRCRGCLLAASALLLVGRAKVDDTIRWASHP